MSDTDIELARRVRDIVAVVADDMDTVNFDVEDGIVYIEGVVPNDDQRRVISSAVSHLDGVEHLITCLATEHVLPAQRREDRAVLVPAPVYMHYHSLS